MSRVGWGIGASLVLATSLALAQKSTPSPKAAEIAPILKAHCLACHGGKEKQGGFSFDDPLTPAQAKEMLRRVRGEGGKPRMPLGFAPLSAEKTAALEKWVAAGMPRPTEPPKEKHWAFQPVTRPLEPPTESAGIDSFVEARLVKEGLSFSPEADKTTLIRRVTLDLIGLPPTPAEVDAFLADTSPKAYEKLVDRLLANPHYGERMALPWLDAARYADSNGFQQDGDTHQWVWRDWVVKSFNENMPFDRFTVEQLAGDLLPNPTLEQKIATAFNRNHLLNGEGGAIPEEQRNVVLFDRVDVTSTTFLGLTLACAQCHDHKYDPLSQKDYYQFLAFFNNVPESGVPPGGGQYRIAEPAILVEPAEFKAKKVKLDVQLASAQGALTRVQAASPSGAAGITLSTWRLAASVPAASFDEAFATDKPLDSLTGGPEHPEWTDGVVQTVPAGDNTAHYLVRTITASAPVKVPLSLGSDDAVKLWLNGSLVLANKINRGAAADQETPTLSLKAGANQLVLKIVNGGGIGGFYFSASLPATPEVAAARERLAAVTRERNQLMADQPRVMVMSDAQPRKTHIYDRGAYLSPKEEVNCGTPEHIGVPVVGNSKTNRLALARWLVNPENPLTARVAVNRFWQQFFGVGLVKTSENFGLLGEKPSHPELLDYLSSEFVDSGWDVKGLVRKILLSRTYKQSSKLSPQLRARDPENRLLARGARFRMPSLVLRDVALASAGLLNDKIGGKPVYPYQPPGIWDSLSITRERDFSYPQSKGEDLYRRSLYTFWRRTVGPGNMFDASSRQACKVRASLTSTPLHALTTLNDVTWVEASRVLAERILHSSENTAAQLTDAFRRILGRRPKSQELAVLRLSFRRAQVAYEMEPEQAKVLLAMGESKRDTRLDMAEHAAMTQTCLSLFNLDEALTRE